MTRGFITIATGAEHYYHLARQLLRSFRCCGGDAVPFALICDRENEYTSEFDDVIVLEHPQRSYMDKLLIHRYSPYDETIFIDADSLVLKDPAALWEDFSDASPVSCYGRIFPLGSDGGWFRHANTGKWRDCIRHQIGLHGGIYYFRRGLAAEQVFETAIALAREYDAYDFREFSKPADEPVMALAMAIHSCLPVQREDRIAFLNALYGRLKLGGGGELYQDGKPCGAIVCHFATKNTHGFLYHYLSAAVDLRYLDPAGEQTPDRWQIRKQTLSHDAKTWMTYKAKRFVKRCIPRDTLKKIRKNIFKK